MVCFDGEGVRGVLEEVGENYASRVKGWEDDIADLRFVFYAL